MVVLPQILTVNGPVTNQLEDDNLNVSQAFYRLRVRVSRYPPIRSKFRGLGYLQTGYQYLIPYTLTHKLKTPCKDD